MKILHILIIFSICTIAAHANQLHYDLMSPGYKDSTYLECDNYVRSNHKTFITDMEDLLKANKNKDWNKVHSIISRYDTKNSFINNAFAKAVYNCGNGYTFSDGGNYYRNLYSALYQYIKGVEEASIKLKRCSPSTAELYDRIKTTLSLIMGATNKAANNTLQLTVKSVAIFAEQKYVPLSPAAELGR